MGAKSSEGGGWVLNEETLTELFKQTSRWDAVQGGMGEYSQESSSRGSLPVGYGWVALSPEATREKV